MNFNSFRDFVEIPREKVLKFKEELNQLYINNNIIMKKTDIRFTWNYEAETPVARYKHTSNQRSYIVIIRQMFCLNQY